MNKETKWTPGPWKVDTDWGLIVGPKHEEIAAIHAAVGPGRESNRQSKECAANNARLIALAPEMAEAQSNAIDILADLQGRIESAMSAGAFGMHHVSAWRELCRDVKAPLCAILAKLEGGK